jgi:hypothetical protein
MADMDQTMAAMKAAQQRNQPQDPDLVYQSWLSAIPPEDRYVAVPAPWNPEEKLGIDITEGMDHAMGKIDDLEQQMKFDDTVPEGATRKSGLVNIFDDARADVADRIVKYKVEEMRKWADFPANAPPPGARTNRRNI